MLKITSNIIRKAASEAQIQLTPKEQQICDHIKKVCVAIPTLAQKYYTYTTSDIKQPPVPRIAGGWVRDKMMIVVRPDVPVKPPKDIDIALDTITGEEFSKFLAIYDQEYGTKAFTAGSNRSESAAAVAVSLGNRLFGEDVEFIQLRKESYAETGNRNSVTVEPGSPVEDAFRRDLTINSMFYNIMTGQVEDFTGQGKEDLASLNLRTPTRPGHDPMQEVLRIFSEDPVRVLRILRFHSRYNGAQIDPVVLEGMKNETIQDLIIKKLAKNTNKDDVGVPPEKSAEELRKIMMGYQPAESMRIMHQVGLLGKLFDFVEKGEQGYQPRKGWLPFDTSQNNPHHDLSLSDHTFKTLENANRMAFDLKMTPQERMLQNFIALTHDFGKMEKYQDKDPADRANPDVLERSYHGHEESSATQWMNFAKKMLLSNEETEFVHDVVKAHMQPHQFIDSAKKLMRAKPEELRKFIHQNPRWKYVMIQAEADSQAKGKEDKTVAALYTRIRNEVIPTLPGVVKNEFRDPNAKGYQSKYRDSEYVLQDIRNFIDGNQIARIIGLKPDAKPKPQYQTQYKPGYIKTVIDKLTEKQYKGWNDLSPETAKLEVLKMRPEIWEIYGTQNKVSPTISADEYRNDPIFVKNPQLIGLVQKEVQKAFLNENADLNRQREVARNTINQLRQQYH